MDIDGAGEGGRLGIIQPPVVSKPFVGVAEQDDPAAARVVDAEIAQVGSVRSAGDTGDALRRIAESFDACDADKDGRVDPKELPLGEFFAQVDANRDGYLTMDELVEAAKAADAAEAPPPKKDGGGNAGGGKDGGGKDGGGKDGKGGRKGPKDRVPGKGGGDMDRGPDETFDDWAKRRIASDPRWNAEVRAQQALRAFDRDPQDGKVARKEYPALDGDRWYATEMRQALDLVRSGAVVEAVEGAIGELE